MSCKHQKKKKGKTKWVKRGKIEYFPVVYLINYRMIMVVIALN